MNLCDSCAGEIEPKNCKIVGDGCKRFPFRELDHRTFQIQTFDKFGNKRTEGGWSSKFRVTVNNQPCNAVIEDCKNGDYIVHYSFSKAGIYYMQVFCGDVNITKKSVQAEDRLTLCVLTAEQNQEVTNNVQSKRVSYEATLMIDNKQQNVTLRATPSVSNPHITQLIMVAIKCCEVYIHLLCH